MTTRELRAKRLADWAEAFGRKRGPGEDVDFAASAGALRDLLQKRLLSLTDLRDDPEYFFLAHRTIAEHGEALGAGFWTRFTVQFNLFAGTVLAVGNASQIASLEAMQAAGALGCFALTEKFAGVSSGMVVETTAEFDAARNEFVISTPSEGAKKNWISQGFVADKAVVVADLRVGGASHGPHAFLMDFRVGGALAPGVRLADMGKKTVCNDLDNAWIAFDGVRVPRSALLDGQCSLDAAGTYRAARPGVHPMEMIGQRLFTGRVAVAQSALVFGRWLFGKTRDYADNKLCWAPRGARPPLSMLPQLSALYDEADEAFEYAEGYAAACERRLCAALRAGEIPKPALVEAIAVAKVRAVETVIRLCFRLKQAIGSYALMKGSGFEELDSMQIAKFAEGESFVLMQKLARDRVKGSGGAVDAVGDDEAAIVEELKGARTAEWLAKAEKVYALAELVMDRAMRAEVGAEIPKGVARPWAAKL
jgi:alkylation response protein AidB-like acyl-CoA dehydrogenase